MFLYFKADFLAHLILQKALDELSIHILENSITKKYQNTASQTKDTIFLIEQ